MFHNPDIQRELLPIKDQVAVNFTQENWLELGTLTNCLDLINRHDRLLRSLNWGDPDYSGHALSVLISIFQRDENNFAITKQYLKQRFLPEGENASSAASPEEKRIYFSPTVFDIPQGSTERDLVAVMMPFEHGFDGVYDAIKNACARAGLRAARADNVWEHSTVVQDIFNLVFRSFIVICDFSGRNPNVFYEAGIAHTLGKHVIPITQSDADIPFDIRHHRYLGYLNNEQGRADLCDKLVDRLNFLAKKDMDNYW